MNEKTTPTLDVDLRHCCLCCFRIQTMEEIASLYSHINTRHGQDKACAACSISFTDVYKLMVHVAQMHPDFQCCRCKKTFKYHEELKVHSKECILEYESDEEEEDDAMCSTSDTIEPPSPNSSRSEYEKTLANSQKTIDRINGILEPE